MAKQQRQFVYVDITGQHKAEEALKASEERYRRLFETAKDGILIQDASTGLVIDVSLPFLIEMVGFPRDEFLGKAVWELKCIKDPITVKGIFLELQRKGYFRCGVLPLEDADGRRIDVEFIANTYDVENQKVIQCNIRAIPRVCKQKKVPNAMTCPNEGRPKDEQDGQEHGNDDAQCPPPASLAPHLGVVRTDVVFVAPGFNGGNGGMADAPPRAGEARRMHNKQSAERGGELSRAGEATREAGNSDHVGYDEGEPRVMGSAPWIRRCGWWVLRRYGSHALEGPGSNKRALHPKVHSQDPAARSSTERRS